MLNYFGNLDWKMKKTILDIDNVVIFWHLIIQYQKNI